eukprot:TRINITY_DN5825_c0_g1_i1.p2 TRINITY_DN5825_c0_g1~~TRINITY_DN5825_c0_g1_i1.p2  ORF type:complete len:372 (-),score=87.46 TRINITY_DN5825_c0_g1_i1:1675-2634(-)
MASELAHVAQERAQIAARGSPDGPSAAISAPAFAAASNTPYQFQRHHPQQMVQQPYQQQRTHLQHQQQPAYVPQRWEDGFSRSTPPKRPRASSVVRARSNSALQANYPTYAAPTYAQPQGLVHSAQSELHQPLNLQHLQHVASTIPQTSARAVVLTQYAPSEAPTFTASSHAAASVTSSVRSLAAASPLARLGAAAPVSNTLPTYAQPTQVQSVTPMAPRNTSPTRVSVGGAASDVVSPSRRMSARSSPPRRARSVQRDTRSQQQQQITSPGTIVGLRQLKQRVHDLREQLRLSQLAAGATTTAAAGESVQVEDTQASS